ncbi:MAG: glycosyltransferase [Candidatus Woesebacteria bacterium]
MKKILIITSTNGHKSIAIAIREQLEQEYTVNIETYISNELQKSYLPFYLFFPGLFRVFFYLGQIPFFSRFFKYRWRILFTPHITSYIREHDPDLVINTFGFFSDSCGIVCEKQNIPYINVIADPFTFYPSFISQKAVSNLFFDASTFATAQKKGIQASQIYASGWFTQKKYFSKFSVDEIREKLQLPTKTLTLLLCGGSEGTFHILKVLFALLGAKGTCTIIVACGKNALLYMLVQKIQLNFFSSKMIRLYPIHFTAELDQYIKASDIVVGKAGPNLLFEAVAARKPFLAVTHISGQEDGNLSFILDKKIGFVEENPIRLRAVLQRIFENPEILEEFRTPLEDIASYNYDSGQRLREHLKKIL